MWTPDQERFLATCEEFASRGKRIVYKDIAEACEVHATTASKWMAHPEFRAAVGGTIRAAHPILIDAADNALLQLALTGNLLAYDKVMTELRARRLELVGGGQSTGPNGQVMNGITVNLGIPLPSGDRSSLPPPVMRGPKGEPLPMPQTLPAPSASSSPAPAVR